MTGARYAAAMQGTALHGFQLSYETLIRNWKVPATFFAGEWNRIA
jgi:hypothetical protein